MQAGTITVDSTLITAAPQEIGNLSITEEALSACLAVFSKYYNISVEEQTVTLTSSENTFALFGDAMIPAVLTKTIVITCAFVDASAVVADETATVIFSDAGDLPDLTKPEGIALFHCYLDADFLPNQSALLQNPG